MNNILTITSPSFTDGGKIPKRHTGFGDDISPKLNIANLSENAAALAVMMNDLDIPMIKEYNHWVIWNIPRTEIIPENIEKAAIVASLGGAVQGEAYGKNRYRGPKQPFFIHSMHRYVFRVFALDTRLDLPSTSDGAALLKAMDGHILQTGQITGTYKRGDD